jgi:hypothetical protein
MCQLQQGQNTIVLSKSVYLLLDKGSLSKSELIATNQVQMHYQTVFVVSTPENDLNLFLDSL